MKIPKALLRSALRHATFFALALLLAAVATSVGYAQRYTGESRMSHLTIEGGGGLTPAVGGTANNVNLGWNVLLGGGYMFNKKMGMLIEYNFNRNGMPDAILRQAQEPGGNYHFWTIAADPIYNYYQGGKLGGYLVGGGGFSRKLVSFTQPFTYTTCDPYFGCYPITQNVVVYHFSSNQPMVDLGTGLTFRFSPYSRTKLFLDARFVKLYTTAAQIPGHNAQLLPVTIGLRW